ncbi:glycosyltransferase family 2 protein [Coleofasciculus sp.]|uniref:glycosyltransferase family 2 protein n=1 Tax=Coleofasciculus sp. TaxID=3100458 RepID=UPI0039F7A438
MITPNCDRVASTLPLVSVIIPAYNAEAFIEKTLKSVLSQTYQNLEVLVVDDGSQDRTPEIIKSIAQQDKRVVLLQQKNAGVAAARNLGIEKSQGEFIAPIDADDIWYPENIEKQVQCFLASDPSVGLVYSWSVDIDENDSPTGGFRAAKIEGEVYVTLLCHDFIANASCVLIRRSCLDKCGSYNCQLREQKGQGGEDWDIYLRIAENYQFRVVPEFMVGYRKRPNSMSCDYDSMAKSRDLIWQSIRKKYPNMPAVIQQLSNSSFYMHLASESSRCARDKSTLFWVYKALQADLITPFFRLGLYLLLIKAIFKIVAYPVMSLIWTDHWFWGELKQKLKSNNRVLRIEDINQRKVTTNFKVLAEKVLHKIAPLVLGTPKTWQIPKIKKHERISSIY